MLSCLALRCTTVALLCLVVHTARANDAAASLRARHAELKGALAQNQFRKPIHLESAELPDSVSGDIYAVIEHPYSTVVAVLDQAANWCDVLILNLNVKYCRPATNGGDSTLAVSIGKKDFQPLDDTYRVEFAYRVASKSASYLKVALDAQKGPLSTRDYRLYFEAIPLDEARSFMHLSYAYGYGLAGRLALQVYLATAGSGKAGFTVIGRQAGGQPQHIGGARGIAERNTMRYYLAIEAYLGALSSPPQARMEKSFRDWFVSAERYPRQLHEMTQDEYLDMKRKEYQRQSRKEV